jgi:RNA polymerase sigma-70 factor, ECF subfamily
MSGSQIAINSADRTDHDPDSRREFRAIVARYYAKVYSLIYRYVGDADEAEDLTQDTFVCAFRAWTTFRGDSAVYTWIYRIAINLSKNRLKQLRRRRTAEAISLDDPVADEAEGLSREVTDWSLSPEKALESKELGLFLATHVTRLADDFKEVVILRDYQDLSYQEIAEVVGCSVKAVKSRLFRARSILRDKLRRYLKG